MKRVLNKWSNSMFVHEINCKVLNLFNDCYSLPNTRIVKKLKKGNV